MKSERVIVAVPAYKAAEILNSLSAELHSELKAIPYAPIVVVCIGARLSDVKRPLDGFGFLVPFKEKRSILGSIWTSSIFSERAPEGQVQFRTMLGGDGNHAVNEMSDEELLGRTVDDLRDIVGLTGSPTVTCIYRWRRGIPQYVIGHRARMDRIEAALAGFPGLHLAGNAYYGIGLNDCVKQAHRVISDLR